MPAAKRKSTEAGLENQVPSSHNSKLPPIADLLKESPIAPIAAKTNKRAKTTKTNGTPLADISNSPAPIAWAAFGSGKLVVDPPTKPIAPVHIPNIQQQAFSPPLEAPAPKKAAPKKAAPKAKPKGKANATAKPAEAPAPAPAPIKATIIAATLVAPKKKPAAKSTKAISSKNSIPDVSAVYLEGEEDNEVPVFDTCDVVRRKITAALTSTAHTKASLMRALAACTSSPDRPIPPNSFQRFMAAKGKTGGSQNRVFYAGYVYFEKLRIAEGKKKTKTREEMEEAWGVNGMDYMDVGKPMILHVSSSLYTNKYGQDVVVNASGREQVMRKMW
ncbi:hypothetical protein ABW20_dc0108282 [Dactylellina cionopaga]|nr:hypothetical protein ABW20_dc0108282 [Dactylellina cionopaga]